mgnify:CR=1 FL=1
MTVAAAGLGTSNNVERAADILALLMMQNGAEMYDDFENPLFNQIPRAIVGRSAPPGAEALEFYTDFANPFNDKVYAWDKRLPSTVDSFARGQLGFFMGYSYHRDQLLAKNPKLNYAIAPMPQLNQESIAVANYWVLGVSKKTANANEAWDFLVFASTNKDVVLSYLKTAQRPTALRALVAPQKETTEVLVPFIDAVLYAKTWYQGVNKKGAEKVFLDLIERVHQATSAGEKLDYIKYVNDATKQLE